MTKRLRPWLPAVAWASVIFVLSCIPGNDFPEVPGAQTDKLVHFVLYGVLAFLMMRGLRATTRLSGPRLVTTGCLLATAYGVTDELHQLFTPHRSCDWHDGVADADADADAVANAGLAGAALATRILTRAPNHP